LLVTSVIPKDSKKIRIEHILALIAEKNFYGKSDKMDVVMNIIEDGSDLPLGSAYEMKFRFEGDGVAIIIHNRDVTMSREDFDNMLRVMRLKIIIRLMYDSDNSGDNSIGFDFTSHVDDFVVVKLEHPRLRAVVDWQDFESRHTHYRCKVCGDEFCGDDVVWAYHDDCNE